MAISLCPCQSCTVLRKAAESEPDYARPSFTRFGGDPKWGSDTLGTSGGTVTWSFYTVAVGDSIINNGDPFLTGEIPDRFKNDVRQAFEVWEQVADITFVEVVDSTDANIRLGTGTIRPTVLGQAFAPFGPSDDMISAVRFNTQFYSDTDAHDHLFLETAIHEVGHAIGLAHEDEVTAIMASSGGNSLEGLTSDDIAGAQSIYSKELALPTKVVYDDVKGNLHSSGLIAASESVNGQIDGAADRDWYRIELTAGREYIFDLQGSDSSGGTLTNPMLQLRDDQGFSVFSGSIIIENDDGGEGLDSRIAFTPKVTGTFWLAVQASDSISIGTYTLAVQDITASPSAASEQVVFNATFAGDLPGGTASTAVLETPGDAESQLEDTGDTDWFRLDLEAGVPYVFSMEGTDTDNGTLSDPFLVLRNENGMFIDQNDDGGLGLNSAISFTPEVSGIYWLEARSFGSTSTGSYKVTSRIDDIPGDATSTTVLSVGSPLSSDLDGENDMDWVQVQLTAGRGYTFDMEGVDSGAGTLADPFLVLRNDSGVFLDQDDDSGEGRNAQITFTPSVTGTYWIAARSFGSDPTGTYTLTMSQDLSPPEVDLTADTESTGQVVLGESEFGEIGVGDDRDWYRVDLDAGQKYVFEVQGADTGAGSIPDPTLHLRNSEGTLLITSDDGGFGLNARIVFSARESGTYWLDAGSFGGRTGTFTVTASEITSTSAPDAPAGDIAGDVSSTAILTMGGEVDGSLESNTDKDWYRVTLTEGVEYTFDLKTTAPSQLDPHLVLRDETGMFLSQDNDSGTGSNSLVVYTPTASGVYFLQVNASDNSSSGDYTLRAVISTPPDGDDVGNTVYSGGTIDVDSSITGAIDRGADSDWYRVELEVGKEYTFELEGSETDGGTLEDPHLLLYDDESNLRAVNDDGGVGLNSVFTFTAFKTGPFWVVAKAFDSTGVDVGTYRLTVSESGESSSSNRSVVSKEDSSDVSSIQTGDPNAVVLELTSSQPMTCGPTWDLPSTCGYESGPQPVKAGAAVVEEYLVLS